MKKWSLITLVIVALVSLAACNQKEGDFTPELNPVTIKASVSNDSHTKTLLGDDSGTETDIYWSDDTSDKICIEINKEDYIFQKSSQTTNSSQAEFNCNNAPSLTAGEYIAKYPDTEIVSYAIQTGTKADLKKWHYMEARFTVSQGNTWNDVNLHFSSKVAILKLTLTNSAFRDQNVTGVTLVSKGATIITTTHTFRGNETTGEIEAYLAIPPTLFETDGVSIKATCQEKDYVATLGDKNLMEGKLYKINKTMEEGGVVNLSAGGAANCYIVSQAGRYMFEAVRGNSYNLVGTIDHVEVLWESFGTSTKPNVGDLISNVTCGDHYIFFSTNKIFKEGNAVIAAKDRYDNVLWSWHIWLTDNPQAQIYYGDVYNPYISMMDRNLGATSATPGETEALGLLYQWGRKDPFLGSSSISSSVLALSTLENWPTPIRSDASIGTIEYSVSHPTTFILQNIENYDWLYNTAEETISGKYRWDHYQERDKTIYDPCPAGWRIPEGNSQGVWSSASKISYVSGHPHTFDTDNYGMDFGNEYAANNSVWYPASGKRTGYDASLTSVGKIGVYWGHANSRATYCFTIKNNNIAYPVGANGKTDAASVRCVQEK